MEIVLERRSITGNKEAAKLGKGEVAQLQVEGLRLCHWFAAILEWNGICGFARRQLLFLFSLRLGRQSLGRGGGGVAIETSFCRFHCMLEQG